MSDTTFQNYLALSTDPRRKISWLVFFTIAILLAAYGIVGSHAYIFGPAYLETGDIAANALQIIDASHFHDIYGNYSRWGFNHPGPFFFYAYSFGETIFLDWFKVVQSPDQAHVLTGIIIQSICFAWAAAEFARLTRFINVFVFAVVTVFVFPHTLTALSSIWPPHVLLGPYFALIISCASLSLGNARALVAAVLMTCILCHGHVAQPLITMPMLGLALICYVRHTQSASGRFMQATSQALFAARSQLIISAIIIGIFLTPIIIDLLGCPDCNAYRILSYMHAHSGDVPNWRQAINYVASFFIFDHTPETINNIPHISLLRRPVKIALLCLGVMILLPHVMRKRTEPQQLRTLRMMILFISLALFLSLVWAKRIAGPLYEFNAFFIYAIVLAIYLTIGATLLAPIRGKSLPTTAFMLVIATTLILVKGPQGTVTGLGYAYKDPMSPLREKKVLALVTQQNHDDWPTTITLALWLARQDIPFMVSNDLAFLFGWNHALNIKSIIANKLPLQIWYTNEASLLPIGQTFDPSRFCRITSQTPPADMDLSLPALDTLRQSCKVATFGMPFIGKDTWGWTEDKLVALQFVSKHADQPVHIDLDVFPFLGDGKLQKQRLELYVNGSVVTAVDIATDRKLAIEVSPAIWNSSKVTTVIAVLPDAASPAKLGISPDGRQLGLGLRSLSIDYGSHDRPENEDPQTSTAIAARN